MLILKSLLCTARYIILFMENVKNNLNVDGKVNSVNEVVNYVHTFHQNFLEEIDLEQEYKNELSNALDKYKDWVVSDKFYEEVFFQPNGRIEADSEQVTFYEAIEMAKSKGLIDGFEYLSLKESGQTIRESYEGNISDAELKSFVKNLEQSWIRRGYTERSEHGKISAIALSVSQSSVEWWEANPDAGFYEVSGRINALPAWAALDIAGGVIGASTAALGQYAINGDINWQLVGWGAVSGAVSTSTGAAGKLVKIC